MSNSPSFPSLRVLFWNANGLSNKINEFRQFMENSNIDLALIQETKFTSPWRFNISNYTLFRNDRLPIPNSNLNPGGGTAIYVRRGLKHFCINSIETVRAENTSIMVLPDRNTKILVSSVYLPPSKKFLNSDFSKIFNSNNFCIVAGDLNAHNTTWNCRNNNTSGRALQNFVTNNPDIKLLTPPSPTHFFKTGSSTIDLALTKNIPYPFTIETLDLFDSDHIPVLITFDQQVDIHNPNPPTYTNWNQFQDILNCSHLYYPSIRSPEDIERTTKNLTDTIVNAKISSTHALKKPRFHNLPARIVTLIKDRNSARKLFQFTRLAEHRQNYYLLRARVRREIRKFKQTNWSEFIQSLSPHDNTIWRFVKILKSQRSEFPPIHGPHRVAFDDVDKANTIAETYRDQFSPNYELVDEDNDRTVLNSVQNFLSSPPTHETDPATVSEISYIIQKLKVKTAPGNDNINNCVLKHLPINIIMYLTVIINAILKFNYFPKCWKTAIVSPIPKPGTDHKFPQNYRPISLLCSLSKITERVILNRITHFLDENEIIIPEQFGFRSQHSTTHQLLRVVEFASEGLQARRPTAALFLDIKCAFDKVWHPGLIYKLIQINMPDSLIHLLHNYLHNRNFAVRINKDLSRHKFISSGIQQGSLLGPTLFNLYINDIPRGVNTLLALYADDTAILSTSHNINYLACQIQRHIDTLESWFTRWKIRINPSKCHAIYFSNCYRNPPRLYLNNSPIEWENTVKYLGVSLDRRMTWKDHVTKTVNKCNAVTMQLRNLIYGQHLSMKNKVLLFKQIILPIALYAIPVWFYAAKTHIKKLEVVQNKTLRRIRRAFRYLSNKTIRRDFNILSFTETAHKLSKRFYEQISNIRNEIIAEFPDYDFSLRANRKRPRACLLKS